MGLIREIIATINLIVVVLMAVFGYWLYASFVGAPTAPYWAEINRNMPDQLRRFSCEQVRKRETPVYLPSCEGY